MTGNTKIILLLIAMVAFVGGFIVYISGRQEECSANGGTLVRVPIGIGWDCVSKVRVRRYENPD